MQDRIETQNRTTASLEERCASLKTTIEQLNLALERASSGESELRNEINALQRSLMESSASSQSNIEKLKQVGYRYLKILLIHSCIIFFKIFFSPLFIQLQKQLSNSENERRILSERLDSTQQSMAELRRTNQTLADQTTRLQNELANNEVQRSGLESQLRLASWPPESASNKDEELVRQLHTAQRERSEMRGKVDALNDKVSRR